MQPGESNLKIKKINKKGILTNKNRKIKTTKWGQLFAWNYSLATKCHSRAFRLNAPLSTLDFPLLFGFACWRWLEYTVSTLQMSRLIIPSDRPVASQSRGINWEKKLSAYLIDTAVRGAPNEPRRITLSCHCAQLI